MNYRICRFSGLAYSSVLDRVMAAARERGEASYESVMGAYFGQGAVYSDAFANAMAAIGNEAREFIFDHQALQRLWAEEHGLAVDDDWRYQVAVAQIRDYAPDILFIQGTNDNPVCNLLPRPDFREQCPSVRLIVGYSGYPMDGGKLRMLDLMLTCTPLMRDGYRAAGLDAHLVYHGFDPGVLDRLDAWRAAGGGGGEAVDFSFLGSTGYGFGGHAGRYWALVSLIARTGLTLWAYEPQTRDSPAALDQLAASLRDTAACVPATLFPGILSDMHQAAFVTLVPKLPLTRLFPQRCRPPVFGLEMFDLLARSRVTFNIHTDAAQGYVANMRLFEATAAGTCLLTDDGLNMRDFFEPGREVVTYSGIEDCIEKATWLLDHDQERRAIAEAGRRRTLRDHTVARRVGEIDAHIRTALQRRGA